MDDNFEIPNLEEVRVIETEDGLKWVNIDDLIVTLHFANDTFEKDTREQLKSALNEQEAQNLEETIEIYNIITQDIVNSLEEITVEFDKEDTEENEDKE